LTKVYVKINQLSVAVFIRGGLSLSIEALKIIEEQSATPTDLQNNLAVVDECGNKGIIIKRSTLGIKKCHLQ